MMYRYAIANVPAKEIAETAQKWELDGSVTEGYGFGKWGVEKTSFVEFSTADNLIPVERFDSFIRYLLIGYNEQVAYRTMYEDHPALISSGLNNRPIVEILNTVDVLEIEKSGW